MPDSPPVDDVPPLGAAPEWPPEVGPPPESPPPEDVPPPLVPPPLLPPPLEAPPEEAEPEPLTVGLDPPCDAGSFSDSPPHAMASPATTTWKVRLKNPPLPKKLLTQGTSPECQGTTEAHFVSPQRLGETHQCAGAQRFSRGVP